MQTSSELIIIVIVVEGFTVVVIIPGKSVGLATIRLLVPRFEGLVTCHVARAHCVFITLGVVYVIYELRVLPVL
jgi:hypothetical protein